MQGVSVVVGGWEVELPSVGWLPLGEVLSCEAVVVSVELVEDVVLVLKKLFNGGRLNILYLPICISS